MKKFMFLLLIVCLGLVVIKIMVPSYKYKMEQGEFEQLLNKINYEVSDENMVNSNKYSSLYEINNDMVGWIKIKGTNIDYPVMYKENDEDYYLTHSFYNDGSYSGVPFVSKNYRDSNNNLLIYAHNINNKTLFGELLKYDDKGFYNRYQIINFDSLDEERVYQIVAVFKDIITDNDEFKYYKFDYNMNREEFKYYIGNIKNMALYDTGIDVSYGDKLITLSTCINDVKDARFIVVAKRIS